MKGIIHRLGYKIQALGFRKHSGFIFRIGTKIIKLGNYQKVGYYD